MVLAKTHLKSGHFKYEHPDLYGFWKLFNVNCMATAYSESLDATFVIRRIFVAGKIRTTDMKILNHLKNVKGDRKLK